MKRHGMGKSVGGSIMPLDKEFTPCKFQRQIARNALAFAFQRWDHSARWGRDILTLVKIYRVTHIVDENLPFT